MPPKPYEQRTPEFFSLHYSGSDLTDAMSLGLPSQNIISLQVRGRASDGNIYRVGLSGANNVFGSFVVIGSPLQDETQFFRRLVGQMEKRYGGNAQIFEYAFNRHRQTACIPVKKPAAVADLVILGKLLKSELSMDGLMFDLYFDGLKNKPRANVSGKLEIRGYTLERHEGFFGSRGNEHVEQPYYTRSYLDEKGQL